MSSPEEAAAALQVAPPRGMVEKMSELRQILGDEPKEFDLLQLLQRCNGDVNATADVFFSGSIPPAQVATPVQTAPPSLVQVTCPDGHGPGDHINVSTPAGLVRATIPNGVGPGANFLVPLPTCGARPVQQPQIIHVVGSPFGVPYGRPYGCYGRPYGYDPVLGFGAGMLGGMLIADALFW